MTCEILRKQDKHAITLDVNGEAVGGRVEPRLLLSDFLRHELGLNGVHVGCEHGVCGACTVLVDGQPQRSCTQFAIQADGHSIITVEGISKPDQLSHLQQAFSNNHALQCGYCTPGILLSATAFLEEIPNPNEAEVRDMLSEHICRCTGYVGIVRAIMDMAGAVRTNQD